MQRDVVMLEVYCFYSTCNTNSLNVQKYNKTFRLTFQIKNVMSVAGQALSLLTNVAIRVAEDHQFKII